MFQGVYALEMYRGQLFAASGSTTPYDTVLGRWDGYQWHPVRGIQYGPNTMKVYQDHLYVAGNFQEVDGQPANQLATYYLPPNCNYYPTPVIVLDTVAPEATQPVQFNHANIVTPGDSITGYSWDFGNGSTASGPTATSTYAAAGTYTVSLTITNAAGCSFTATETLEVGEWSSAAPQVEPNDAYTVHPNPAKGMVRIDGPANGPATLKLFSTAGALLHTETLQRFPAQVELPNVQGTLLYSIQEASGKRFSGRILQVK